MRNLFSKIKLLYAISSDDVLIDLRLVSKSRSVLMLMAPLLAMQKKVFIKLSGNAAVFGLFKDLKDTHNMFFVLLPLGAKNSQLTITDVAGRTELKGKIMRLDYFYSPALKALSYPYLMHHWRYIKYDYALVARLRKSIRRIKLFFSGNTDPNFYDDNRFSDVYHMLNRYEIVEVYKNSVTHNMDVKQFYTFMESGDQWDICFLNRVEGGIKSRLWLNALALSDFFLAPPGVIMPMSHNIIEAMAVGTIPITNYGHWFKPPLQDGMNCIAFQDKVELEKAIQKASTMSTEDIAAMRQHVINYYEAYLNPFTWYKKNIFDSSNKQIDVAFLDEDFFKISKSLLSDKNGY